jgi:hypothetical protein
LEFTRTLAPLIHATDKSAVDIEARYRWRPVIGYDEPASLVKRNKRHACKCIGVPRQATDACHLLENIWHTRGRFVADGKRQLRSGLTRSESDRYRAAKGSVRSAV